MPRRPLLAALRARRLASIVSAAALLAALTASPVAAAEPTVSFEYPLPARTGQPFTIHPVYSDGFVPAPTDVCRWEFRWGNTASLRDNEFDDTFGFLLFEGAAADGFCGDWDFTLPWVPVPQFEVDFRGPVPTARSGIWPDREVFTATVSGTERRITASNLPLAQVLPSTYHPTAGDPITYTRYLVGGLPSAGEATWTAHLGSGENPTVWDKHGTSSTFTFTPKTTGRLLVQWYRETGGYLVSAGYDPTVGTPDTSKPNTTTPKAVQALAESNTGVPVDLTWTGTDSGSGIVGYGLQRQVDGGAWTTITLPNRMATTFRVGIAYDHAHRFRVRALDGAGNVGSWDYGPTITPIRVGDTSTRVAYSGVWSTSANDAAFGDVVHTSTAPGASASLAFTARDIGWLAERGPNRGRAKVYLDGVLKTTIDLQSSTVKPRQIVYRYHWSSSAAHTIKVVAEGTVGRPLINVDGFVYFR